MYLIFHIFLYLLRLEDPELRLEPELDLPLLLLPELEDLLPDEPRTDECEPLLLREWPLDRYEPELPFLELLPDL